MANMTPMMRQYLEMKDKYPGMILFFPHDGPVF